MKKFIGYKLGTKEREIKFIETVFNYNLNFNKVNIALDETYIKALEKILLSNNCNYYINCLYNSDEVVLNIFHNQYLTYEILSKLFMDIDFKKIKSLNYSKIKSNIDRLNNLKMEKLANYCFKFNYEKWTESQFIQLTPERLAAFVADFAAKYEPAPTQIIPVPLPPVQQPITTDVITEYLMGINLSNEEKEQIISVLLR